MLCIFLWAPAAASATSDRYLPHYFGVNTEWDFTADADEPVRSFISSRYLGLGLAYGYGRGLVRPRLRANLGYTWDAGFTPSVGLELPLFERLSSAQSKLFGVYVTGDVGWAFGYDDSPVYRITPHVRLPLGPISGIGIGASYHSTHGWTVFIGRLLGAYPLRNKQ
ncbi:hypothetical protein [Spirochaeta africana]|uniref:hypothetical protein n=1 Tax=Spirochaeta africana TaxID=46355 RepID=UPI00059C8422|nr:hypothetical protein [Spirochaeta africana]